MPQIRHSLFSLVGYVLVFLCLGGKAEPTRRLLKGKPLLHQKLSHLSSEAAKVADELTRGSAAQPHRRLLAAAIVDSEFILSRMGPSLYFANVLGLTEEELQQPVEVWAHSDGSLNDPALYGAKALEVDSIEEADKKNTLVVKLTSDADFGGSYIWVNFVNSNQMIRSSKPLEYNFTSGYSGLLILSFAMAIVYMALSCCCWIFGVKQFYHLIRIAQLLFMINLMSSRQKPASAYAMLEGFRYNIFNIVPNPVEIDEREALDCTPKYEFWAEGLSCHAYNTLRNYVLGFIIYLVLYFFIVTNKYHNVHFWNNLRRTMRFTVFMLAIMPDVFIAIYVNAVAPLDNAVLSLGFLFCIILVFWYGLLIWRYISLWANNNLEIVAFLEHYMFSRSNLTIVDKKLGLKVLAVTLENLKVLVVVTMIALFNNSSKTQLIIVLVVYILNAVFLFVVRPYNGTWQNIFFGVSDLAFFVLVLVLYLYHGASAGMSQSKRENTYGATMVAMVWIIFFMNLIVYILPVLKGHDKLEVIPSSGGETDGRLSEYNHKSERVKSDMSRLEHPDEKSQSPLVKRAELVEDKSSPVNKLRETEKRIETADGSKRRLV